MAETLVDVALLGRLARLDFTSAEAKHFSEQLPRILDYVGQLQAVPLERATPTAMPVIPGRSDVVDSSPVMNKILDAAPERQGDFWKVSSVF